MSPVAPQKLARPARCTGPPLSTVTVPGAPLLVKACCGNWLVGRSTFSSPAIRAAVSALRSPISIEPAGASAKSTLVRSSPVARVKGCGVVPHWNSARHWLPGERSLSSGGPGVLATTRYWPGGSPKTDHSPLALVDVAWGPIGACTGNTSTCTLASGVPPASSVTRPRSSPITRRSAKSIPLFSAGAVTAIRSPASGSQSASSSPAQGWLSHTIEP